MAVSQNYLEHILDLFSGWDGVSVRKMFGGAGLYRDGKMFGLVANDITYLKVDDTNRDKFASAESSPFKPYPDRPTVMSYFEIPPEVLEDREELIRWAEESLAIQKKKK